MKVRKFEKEAKMVAGHLQEKKGYYYIVLNYQDGTGKRRSKWRATGLPVKGNKRRAEEMLQEARRTFAVPGASQVGSDMLFADFMEYWLETLKPSLRLTSYSTYCSTVKGGIAPYFRERGTKLSELTARDIQDFYAEQLRRITPRSVLQFHVNLHKALKYAVRTDLLQVNPMDKVDRPKQTAFVGGFYNADEITRLFEAAKGTKLELAVLFGAFYGLRRSEIVGLKWDAIDFQRNTLAVNHTVVCCNLDGKYVLVAADQTKTASSKRTLPLVPQFRARLLALKAGQEENRRLCGASYNGKYEDYIYVNEVGERIDPTYISSAFPRFVVKHGLRRIRFHDLRHSCASLLLANGVSMKQIQEWLGHSNFATTANLYAHLEYKAKVSSANALLDGLKLAL
jgi:integrase